LLTPPALDVAFVTYLDADLAKGLDGLTVFA
jgi:hypothetical protein